MTATSNTETNLSLRERAMQAWADARADSERIAAARAAEEAQERAELLGNLLMQRLGLNVTPDGPTIEIDGLTFSAGASTPLESYVWEWRLYLVDNCVECGWSTTSDDIQDLASLGAILETWTPHCRGGCVELPETDEDDDPEPPMTTEHWLAKAIRQVVHNELREAGYVGDR